MSGDRPACRCCGRPPVWLQVITPAHLQHSGTRRATLAPVDACVAEEVEGLNRTGRLTANACCGHGEGPATAILHDGTTVQLTPKRTVRHASAPSGTLSSA